MIFIVVKFTARPERSAEWLDLVQEFTTAVRAEPGNIFFEWSTSAETPNEFVLLEAFADGEAGSVHVNSDHFKKAMAWMPSVIASKPRIINVETEGTGWSEMAELTPTN
ncbi:MAG TPA: putative quinol monooxygenase [Pseudonocardiaceae bacterium]|jgi:quinol monooxygenase YgiN